MIRSSSGGRSGFSCSGDAGVRLRMPSNIESGGVAMKRRRAGRHLVQHDAEREQIGARVNVLRRAPARATCTRPFPPRSPDSSSRARSWSPRSRQLLPVGRTLASPKSRIFAWPRLVTNRFAGLMSRCTMPAACAASSASAISIASVSSRSMSSGRAADALLQRRPVEELHDEERAAVLLADIVDRADVGVIQRRCGPRLAAETGQGSGSSARSGDRNFSATKRCSRVSSALYTTPMPPPPSFSMMR